MSWLHVKEQPPSQLPHKAPQVRTSRNWYFGTLSHPAGTLADVILWLCGETHQRI